MAIDNHELSGEQIIGLDPLGFFGETNAKANCSVKVAVRIRPILPKEVAAGDGLCVQVNNDTTVTVGIGKMFSFDKVFGSDSTQEEMFRICAKNLLLSSFAGYNSTVLAYGQTCSGKTFTMGTDAALTASKEQQGIIPRVVQMMFDEIEKRKTSKEFIIKVSFIEIYNEEICDLLDPQAHTKITIREFTRGIPSLCGQQEEKVSDYEGLFKLLERGAVHRRTRSTLMNENSSRSHAILVINIEQHLIEDLYQANPSDKTLESNDPTAQEFITAKFHFVDLAGSERIKKTGAEGEALQEGININKALFVLGKVINALTDETGRNQYKPYRESNLTRILQDSLGGNARTTMIACVSPADSNQEETLSTLLYACKARSIKNKPVINRDPNSMLIHQLQQQILDLKREVARFKKAKATFDLPINEPCIELPSESEYRAEIAALKRKEEELKESIKQLEAQCRKREIEFFEIQKERDVLKLQNEKLKEMLPKEVIVNDMIAEEELSVVDQYRNKIKELEEINRKRISEIGELRGKYEEECKTANLQSEQMFKLNQELQHLKREMLKMKKEAIENKGFTNNLHSEKPLDQSKEATTWISEELDEQLKEANEIFINELTQSLEALVVESNKEITVDQLEELEEMEEIKKDNQDDIEINETLSKVEGDINEREKMLEQIKGLHKEMQKNLITIMEQQYHKKIEDLERDIEKLKKDQEKAVQLAPKDNRGTIDLQYKKKIGEYETKIKDYKKNQANQQRLLKQVNEQENKIHLLTDEIGRMKQQKVELTKQMRRERIKYEKKTKEQNKESLKLKQETIKQKLLIKKLISEKERAAKYKTHARKDNHITNFNKELIADYRNLVEDFTTRLVGLRKEAIKMHNDQQKQTEIKGRLDNNYSVLYSLELEIEKIEMKKKEYNTETDYDKIKQAEVDLEQLKVQVQDRQTIIDNLESTLEYYDEKAVAIEQNRQAIKLQLAKY